jgi:hypothetical protein
MSDLHRRSEVKIHTGDWLSCLWFLIIFLSLSMPMPGYWLEIVHEHFYNPPSSSYATAVVDTEL